MQKLRRVEVTDGVLVSMLTPDTSGASSFWEFRDDYRRPEVGDVIGFYLSGRLVAAARVERVEPFRHQGRRTSLNELKEGVRAYWNAAGVCKVLTVPDVRAEDAPALTVFGTPTPFALAPKSLQDAALNRMREQADFDAAISALEDHS